MRHRDGCPPARPDRGFALLIVLWTLAVLALLVSRIGASARGEAHVAYDLRSNLVQEEDVDGVIYATAFHLLDRAERQWDSDGVTHTLDRPGGSVRVRVTNEADRVNLNTASADLLHELLIGVGVDTMTAERLGAAIVDWREQPRTSSQAERIATQYRAAGLPYLPPGEAFRRVDEVGLVAGMTPEITRRLAPHLTIYSTYGPARSTPDPVVAKALLAVRATAGLLPLEAGAGDVRVVRIVAVSIAGAGSRFTREAVLRLDPGTKEQSVVILAWEAGEDAEK